NDGKIDIATANYNTNTTSVLLGNGNATFQPKTDYTASATPLGIVAGDLNCDGYAEIVTTSSTANTMAVLINDANWTGPGIPVISNNSSEQPLPDSVQPRAATSNPGAFQAVMNDTDVNTPSQPTIGLVHLPATSHEAGVAELFSDPFAG